MSASSAGTGERDASTRGAGRVAVDEHVLAWLLGVPAGVLVLIYFAAHVF